MASRSGWSARPLLQASLRARAAGGPSICLLWTSRRLRVPRATSFEDPNLADGLCAWQQGSGNVKRRWRKHRGRTRRPGERSTKRVHAQKLSARAAASEDIECAAPRARTGARRSRGWALGPFRCSVGESTKHSTRLANAYRDSRDEAHTLDAHAINANVPTRRAQPHKDTAPHPPAHMHTRCAWLPACVLWVAHELKQPPAVH